MNVSSGALLPTRTYQLAWPLWGTGARGDDPARAAAAADSILAADMLASDSGLVPVPRDRAAWATHAARIPALLALPPRG